MTTDRDQSLPPRVLETANLRMRPHLGSDADDIVQTCRQASAQRYISSLPERYTVGDALDFIHGPANAAWKEGRAQWAIADGESDRYLGSIGVPRIQRSFETAEIGYLVAPWAQGRGVAAEATVAVTEFLFEHAIARVELHIMPSNIASQRVALRAGFRFDGELRGAISTRQGDRAPRRIYSRLPDDPPGPTARTLPDLPGGGLTDGVVTLRPLGPQDTDSYFAHQDLPEVWGTSVPPTPPSRDAVTRLCEYGAASAWLEGSAARMVIEDAESKEHAGEISLHMFPLGEAMIGYGLDRRFRGRGLMTRAVALMSRWALEEVGVDRLVAGTAVDNLGSQAVLRRAGFTREGVERSRLPGKDGSRIDNVVWSLLPGDLG